MINELSKRIHAINVKNGFYEQPVLFSTSVALIHSEASEALEADRKGNNPSITSKSAIFELNDVQFKKAFEDSIKNGVNDELADIMIRVMDVAAYKGVDLEAHIKAKMRYNSLREYKHGKNY